MRLRPLSPADFAALMAPFAPFERNPQLAVAVSGGRDSLALALLADEWVRAHGGRILALIVDHGLRPESTAEAQSVRDILARLGIAAEILSWTGPKPRRAIQEAARAARYRLLQEACRAHGILHLLLAHHADDQDETVAMRAARDSGADGLAGMAALVEHEEVRLLRPLLGVQRAALTAFLQSRHMQWIDDPSNADLRFERARLRAGKIENHPWREAGRRRSEHESAVACAAVELVEIAADGKLSFGRDAFARLPRLVRLGLLSRIVQAVGGGAHPPKRVRLAAAASRLSQAGERGKSGKSQDFTLSGCRLALRKEPERRQLRWIVWPESGRNGRKKGVQPLIPAAFSACGTPQAPHLG